MRYLIIACILIGCVSNPKNARNNKVNEVFDLPDSLFVLKDIKNLDEDIKFWTDDKYELCTDSITKTHYVVLDSIQKVKLIVPVTSFGGDYLIHFMNAVFVSKQKKIGEYTPIIIHLNGDDYGSLIYIVLDKDLKAVSSLELEGGFCAGPTKINDSLCILCDHKESFLKGKEIFTYVLKESTKTLDSLTMANYDSLSYQSRILSSGIIETKLIDSTRIVRMAKWQ